MQSITSAFQHIPQAGVTFVHPLNGNVYIGVCAKEGDGVKQHFLIYRMRTSGAFELVKQYQGGIELKAQVTMGGIAIRQDGAMVVAFSGVPLASASGRWEPIVDVVPNVDAPWALPVAVNTASTSLRSVRMRNPSGWKNYGGVGKGYQPSANGFDYFYVCGTRNGIFGMYVLRQSMSGNEPAVFVEYTGPLMTGRGEMYVGGDGRLYVTGHTSDTDVTPRVETVPGFVPFGNVVAYVGAAAPQVNTVDQTARGMAQSAADNAGRAISTANQALRDANAALTRPIPAPVADSHIADIAWQKAIDYSGTPDFEARVKNLAQKVLIDAIEFAKTATAEASRLRALILQIIAGK